MRHHTSDTAPLARAQPRLQHRLRAAAEWLRAKRNLAADRADAIDELVGTISVHCRPGDLDRLADLLDEAAAGRDGAK